LSTYRIRSKDPVVQLAECSIATGAPIGSSHISQEFVHLLRSKLGPKASERVLTPKNLAEALRSFEILKFDFNPYDPDCREEFKIPIVWVPNLTSVSQQVREGHYLRLSK